LGAFLVIPFITVQPAREHRVGFARWAVTQVPKVRTVSTTEFAVPHALFTGVPEQLLIGAVVDGHAYVSPDEDEQVPDDLLGVFVPEREGIPGEPLPEVPAEAYPPDAVPLEAAPTDEGSDSSDRVAEQTGPYCGECERPFKSDRALAAHRRQAHPED
jgi:hypothetical protein